MKETYSGWRLLPINLRIGYVDANEVQHYSGYAVNFP